MEIRIDDRRLGPDFRFYQLHRVVDDTGKVIGYRHPGELRANLEPLLLRRTRTFVLGELPPRTIDVLGVGFRCEMVGSVGDPLERANRFSYRRSAVRTTAG